MKMKNIICPNCKYQNHEYNVLKYGTCKLCGRILDKKAKYRYEMFVKLRKWRKK